MSLRRRLLRSLALGLVLLGLLVGGGLYLYLARVLVREFDRSMLSRLEGLASLVEREISLDLGDSIDEGRGAPEGVASPAGGEVSPEGLVLPLQFDIAAASTMPEFSKTRHENIESEYFAVWTAEGDLLARSPTADGVDLSELFGGDPPTVPVPEVGRWNLRTRNTALPDGDEGRAAILRLYPRQEVEDERGVTIATSIDRRGAVTVALATSRLPLDRSLLAVAVGMTICWLAFAAGTAIVLAWSLAVGTAPLHRWAEEVEKINPDAQPLEATNPVLVVKEAPAELRPVALTLRDLLDRVASTLERERRFNDDVSHELRTPLAEIRSAAEVALGRPGLRDEERATLDDIAAAAGELGDLVSTLLEIRRSQEGEELPSTAVESTDVADLVRRLTQAACSTRTAAERRVRLEVKLLEGLFATTSPTLLSTAANNLLLNAVAHATQGSTARITLTADERQLRLVVTNAVDDLTEDDVGRLTDPFWRKSKTRGGGHSGIGLTLADAAVRRLNGSLAFRLVGRQLTATLQVPLRSA